MSSGTVSLRRQQLKIMKSFQSHMASMDNLHEKDNCIHSMITDWIKTKNDMKAHSLTEIECKLHFCKSDVFQDDWQVDPKEKHILVTSHMKYSSFICHEEKKERNPSPTHALYRAGGKPFLHMPNLMKDGNKRCNGCRHVVMNCHDVLCGPFGVYKVIKFSNQDMFSIDDVVVKKTLTLTRSRGTRDLLKRGCFHCLHAGQ